MEVGKYYVDFVQELPKSPKWYDAIWIIADCLIKSAHFLIVAMTFLQDKSVQLFIQEIVRLYGIPTSITSNLDSRFTVEFWKSLHTTFGIDL